jgi:hypothetical protein
LTGYIGNLVLIRYGQCLPLELVFGLS